MAAAAIAEEFLTQSRTFQQRTKELGYRGIERYYWYHTIDLGQGLITPGLYDFRKSISSFDFPRDMKGISVLDVGSATGFFAFEFERRGARVVSTELGSLRDLDSFPGQDMAESLRKIERMIFPDGLDLDAERRGDSERELYHCLLNGPFQFCRQRLNSRVERVYSTVYELTLGKTGSSNGFDLVFVGDVLLHTLYPLKALAALAPLCRDTLVFSQILPEGPQEPPAMRYMGGSDPNEDELCWWLPNQSCLTEMLLKLRFRSVEEVGWHTGVLQPGGHHFKRIILRARK